MHALLWKWLCSLAWQLGCHCWCGPWLLLWAHIPWHVWSCYIQVLQAQSHAPPSGTAPARGSTLGSSSEPLIARQPDYWRGALSVTQHVQSYSHLITKVIRRERFSVIMGGFSALELCRKKRSNSKEFYMQTCFLKLLLWSLSVACAK